VIAFVFDDGAQRDIYLMNADGSGMMPLTNDPGWDNWPTWSPDGAHLAFTCRAPIAGLGGGICRINVDGTGREQLTSSNDWEPSWSPNGKYIVFASQRDGNPEIYMMNADGTNQRRLTHSDDNDWQAAWSPDSTHLAFARGATSAWDIYIMDVSDGGITGDSELVRLTNNDVADGFPAWSNDGSQILFSSMRDGNEEIYIMNSDGTNQTRLTYNTVDDTFPRWSADGQHIVFIVTAIYSGIHSTEIAIMDVDGSHQHKITKTALIEEACPRWRPIP
jgi:Tol biopolymer transport system component